MRHRVTEFLENFSKVSVEMKSQIDNHTLKTAVGNFLRL